MSEDSKDLSVVAQINYHHEAEMALGYLESAGLEAGLFIDDAGGSQVGMAFATPGNLVVGPQDRERAIEILESAGYGDRIQR